MKTTLPALHNREIKRKTAGLEWVFTGGIFQFVGSTVTLMEIERAPERIRRLFGQTFDVASLLHKIKFDEFPLNEPMCSEYRLENLPHIRKIVGLYFKVCGVADKSDFGTLKYEVRDDKNNTVVMMTHRPLKDLIWSKDSGDPCYYIYDLEAMKFMPEKGMHYKLSFEFTPKRDVGEAVGSLYIRCGGSL